MQLEETGNSVRMTNFDSFDISEILECGQCFRFERLGEGLYSIVALGKVLLVKQEDCVSFSYPGNTLDLTEFNALWRPYFDLNRDYSAIKAQITEGDPIMARAVAFAPGIRLLNQEPWETTISFIISANNRIPMIKHIVKNIASKWGTAIKGGHHAFPTVKELGAAQIEDLRGCKAGFRDKYIFDAIQKAASNAIPIVRSDIPTDELKKMLLSVNGIGEKVANCILLLGFGRHEVFPVDVWVRRAMERLYPGGKDFGPLAGFANQYLFHFIRSNP